MDDGSEDDITSGHEWNCKCRECEQLVKEENQMEGTNEDGYFSQDNTEIKKESAIRAYNRMVNRANGKTSEEQDEIFANNIPILAKMLEIVTEENLEHGEQILEDLEGAQRHVDRRQEACDRKRERLRRQRIALEAHDLAHSLGNMHDEKKIRELVNSDILDRYLSHDLDGETRKILEWAKKTIQGCKLDYTLELATTVMYIQSGKNQHEKDYRTLQYRDFLLEAKKEVPTYKKTVDDLLWSAMDFHKYKTERRTTVFKFAKDLSEFKTPKLLCEFLENKMDRLQSFLKEMEDETVFSDPSDVKAYNVLYSANHEMNKHKMMKKSIFTMLPEYKEEEEQETKKWSPDDDYEEWKKMMFENQKTKQKRKRDELTEKDGKRKENPNTVPEPTPAPAHTQTPVKKTSTFKDFIPTIVETPRERKQTKLYRGESKKDPNTVPAPMPMPAHVLATPINNPFQRESRPFSGQVIIDTNTTPVSVNPNTPPEEQPAPPFLQEQPQVVEEGHFWEQAAKEMPPDFFANI